MKKHNAIIHGECLIVEIDNLPSDCQQDNTNSDIYIVAESEVSGNHHVIDKKPETRFYHNSRGRYMVNTAPAQVRCVIANRHTEVSIPPGAWEIGAQQEYDYVEQVKRNVRD